MEIVVEENWDPVGKDWQVGGEKTGRVKSRYFQCKPTHRFRMSIAHWFEPFRDGYFLKDTLCEKWDSFKNNAQ